MSGTVSATGQYEQFNYGDTVHCSMLFHQHWNRKRIDKIQPVDSGRPYHEGSGFWAGFVFNGVVF